MTFKIDVIIPTFKDEEALLLCLEHLRRQTLDTSDFRVIVCNNDPGTPLVKTLSAFPEFTFITEPSPGSYSARNRAIIASDSPLIAFTDADCQPSPDWLKNGLKHLEKGADLVAGRVILEFQSRKLSAAECYEKVFGFDQESNAKKGVSVTANLVARRNCFDKIGNFNTQLMSGGDVEWTKRATDFGLKLVYGADCVVGHPARASIREILKKTRRVTGGLHAQNETPPIWKLITLFLLPPLSLIKRLFANTELSFSEKCKATWVAYLVKLRYYSEALKLNLKMGTPTRS